VSWFRRWSPNTRRFRFDLWVVQLLIDADNGLAGDGRAAGDVQGDVTTLEWVLKRFGHTLDSTAVSTIEARLADLKTAAEASDFTAAKQTAGELRAVLPAF